MNNEQNLNNPQSQQLNIAGVSGSVIEDRCKSVLKYLIPDYETAKSIGIDRTTLIKKLKGKAKNNTDLKYAD